VRFATKQKPQWPSIAPALALRARDAEFTLDLQTNFFLKGPNNVVLILAPSLENRSGSHLRTQALWHPQQALWWQQATFETEDRRASA
jgi:hypothetical protein